MYNNRCYFCHGYSGDAKTIAAGYLRPPPRDFTATDPQVLTRERMLRSVWEGRTGTAMKPFKGLITRQEQAAVVDYIRQSFMLRRAANTAYHTPENGWPNHARYAAAFPFVRGEVSLDTPAESLTARQREGRRLFLSACITCHEGRPDQGAVWDPRAVSYPRGGYSPRNPPDAVSSATPYRRHEQAPAVAGLTALERQGEGLYQKNCAFCHAADGTARNWIGTFLQPHPRDLTQLAQRGMTRARLKEVIRDGLPGTTMSAWRNVFTPQEIDAVAAYVDRAFARLAK